MKTTQLGILLALLIISVACQSACADDALAAGACKGKCTTEGEAAVTLSHCYAFVDQKDDRKPTLLIVSDIELPADQWTSEFDLMEKAAKFPFSGAIFFLDDQGAVFRSDFYWKGRQSSVSGYFAASFDKKTGGEFIGTVATSKTSDPKDPKVDASFHAKVKTPIAK